ncbi:sigma-70 family RNA polymerase sigma factor [Pseudoflavonifractor sp. 524-17]|uniref:RNA polymerase sigma factor n=1 Tax=Pseudoflavonifractor sp. 524-17 TaxID=2304577 RepID=UPI00137B738F|nr:sigma factor-like helix-turn-helix DNA-binding protein [Pseudoflavonifractor sp. 524-17]NCE66117.1 sigma-70 family RNA polymerase sigma factor [Pseudoflavonifractor sp. 524-17]
MEITIKINGRFVSVEVSAEVADYLEQAKRNNRKLYRERQRYWDGRECDEYIISTEGRLPYCATPEELVCQRETLDEILAVLALCTPTQRERFLLYALYDFNYSEIGEICGCSKQAVRLSIEAVRKKFFKIFR